MININKLICTLLITFTIKPSHITDFGQLYPATVQKTMYPSTTQEVQDIIKMAKKNNHKISIAGAQHSQGGHSYASNSININLKNFNKLIALDVENKTVKVQSGMTWEQLQNILHPHNLSVAIMQASNIFTTGGSASVNIHGRDPFFGPMIESIKSISIINDEGEILFANRKQNSELFCLAIGGYGLFGFIAEIELSVKDNCICKKEKTALNYKEYPKHLKKNILTNKNIELHYARLNVTPGKNFLKELISFEYINQHKTVPKTILPEEKNISLNKYVMQLYRKYWGKLTNSLRWLAEEYLNNPWEKVKILTRNHAMRPYIHALENPTEGYTDLLQEYFIPPSHFTLFVQKLAELTKKYEVKLMNVTLRWTPKNTESFLSYSQKDTIAFVLYFTCQINDQELKNITAFSRAITTACLDCGGTFYLPYQRFATKSQLIKGYPKLPDFIEKKKKDRSFALFTSNWYSDYLLPTLSK